MRRLCRLPLLFAALAAAPLVPLAAEESAETKVSADFAYATSYVFRGLRLSSRTLQPAVTIEHGRWSGGVWTDLPTTKGEQHEFDPWLFYSWEEDGTAWEAGAQYYYYPEARGTDLRYSYEFSLGGSREVPWLAALPLTAGATVYYDPRLETLSLEGTLAHTISLGTERRPVDLTWSVFAGHVDARNIDPDDPGPKWRDAYRYYGAKAELSITLAPRATLKLTGQWDDAVNADPDQGGTRNLSGVFAFNWAW
ncbi:MAG: hypothetical protein HYV95_14375 [Opitutae bacterium]|nr:hypothetical protein [Opitutae bacterium]